MPSTPTVFLSAASIDLEDWREVLYGAFSRAGFRVLTQDQSLRAACLSDRPLADSTAKSHRPKETGSVTPAR